MTKQSAKTDNKGTTFSHVGVAAIAGALMGLLVWLLNLLLQNFLFIPLFCDSTQAQNCASGQTWAWWLAAVIIGLVSLYTLAKANIYRPLLVIIASLIAVWGMWTWLGGFTWWQAALWQAIIFALAYALFTLLARINNFLLSLAAIVAAIIVVRLVSLLA